MTDTEILDLLQHYRWCLYPQGGHDDLWAAECDDWCVFGSTPREAIKAALAEQAKRTRRPE